MNIVRHRKIFYTFSAILVIISIFSICFWGLNFGIDFKGGSLIEISYPAGRPTLSEMQDTIGRLSLGEVSIRPTGNNGYIIRTKSLSDSDRTAFLNNLGPSSGYVVNEFDSVGPILGQELQAKAMYSIIAVIIAIVLFITFAFRKVSEPVSSFKYGLVAIVALVHDVIVPTGAFAILGHFAGLEIDTLFITALLVILGFSVHDTIVVFDRVRENLKNRKASEKKSFETIVGESIQETFTRSINTSLTVLLSLVVLYIFGSEATRDFALALLIGITAGTYSSVFLGSPLLVTLEKWQNRKK